MHTLAILVSSLLSKCCSVLRHVQREVEGQEPCVRDADIANS